MHILITRPHDDAVLLASRLKNEGIGSTIESLLEITYLNRSLPDLSNVRALLITSANGIRAFSRLSENRSIKVWTIGNGSAEVSRKLGFVDVHSASGDVDAFAKLVGEREDKSLGSLLHIAGSRVKGDMGGYLENLGFHYQRCVLYDAQAVSVLSRKVISQFSSGCFGGVVFYSPRTAEIFINLIIGAGLHSTLANTVAFCLSPAVRDKVDNLHWGNIVVSKLPSEVSLIAKVLEMVTKV